MSAPRYVFYDLLRTEASDFLVLSEHHRKSGYCAALTEDGVQKGRVYALHDGQQLFAVVNAEWPVGSNFVYRTKRTWRVEIHVREAPVSRIVSAKPIEPARSDGHGELKLPRHITILDEEELTRLMLQSLSE